MELQGSLPGLHSRQLYFTTSGRTGMLRGKQLRDPMSASHAKLRVAYIEGTLGKEPDVCVTVLREVLQAGADRLLHHGAIDDRHHLLHQLGYIEPDVGDLVLACSCKCK
eukprot:scaffold221743_cov42-Prasinocladus_malaysianus.AAC.1